MSSADEVMEATRDGRARFLLFAWGAFAGVVAGLIFVGFPQLDIAISGMVFRPERGFLLQGHGPGEVLRQAFNGFFAGLCAIAALGVLLGLLRRKLFGRGFRSWFFLGLLLALGPGIIANLVLKDHWGRPRPRQTVEFGGARSFAPALARSGTCPKNCSFIGGEASSAYASGFGLALFVRRRRRRILLAAVAFGTVAGLVRIAQGAHFASDIVFAGAFMAIIAAFSHWLAFADLSQIRRRATIGRQYVSAQDAASKIRSWGRADPPQ
jgi:lipid A 4'-phosphatase